MNREEEWLLKEKWLGEKTEGFFTDCNRLQHGEPLAYIIGHVPFLNTKIFLDSHPLIPRTETEFWVEKVIDTIKKRPNPPSECRGLTPTLNRRGRTPTIKVLDLCAGSGCIGVAMLKHIQNACVDFAEIDTVHHATIRKNIQENEIDIHRTSILGGDLFEQVTRTYDYILTNPPYIDPVLDRTQKSVKEYEPTLALYGGKEGMEVITKIIMFSPKFLSKDGILVIEHEPEQCDLIHTIAEEAGYASNTYPDQFGVSRYTYLSRMHE